VVEQLLKTDARLQGVRFTRWRSPSRRREDREKLVAMFATPSTCWSAWARRASTCRSAASPPADQGGDLEVAAKASQRCRWRSVVLWPGGPVPGRDGQGRGSTRRPRWPRCFRVPPAGPHHLTVTRGAGRAVPAEIERHPEAWGGGWQNGQIASRLCIAFSSAVPIPYPVNPVTLGCLAAVSDSVPKIAKESGS